MPLVLILPGMQAAEIRLPPRRPFDASSRYTWRHYYSCGWFRTAQRAKGPGLKTAQIGIHSGVKTPGSLRNLRSTTVVPRSVVPGILSCGGIACSGILDLLLWLWERPGFAG